MDGLQVARFDIRGHINRWEDSMLLNNKVLCLNWWRKPKLLH